MSPVMEEQGISVEQEFEKNPDMNKKDLEKLKDWITTQKHLPKIPDEMLIVFHHSCYFDMDRTKDCIEVYYTIRTQATDLFTKRDVTDPLLAKSLAVVNITMLPVPDPNGYHIVYHALRDTDPSHYNHTDDNKLTFMTIDAWLQRNGTAPGIVILLDIKGSKLGHLARSSLSTLKYATKYVQEGSPIRLKAIHVINTVSWIDKIMNLIRPFTSKEILNMMNFHKNDNATLYDYLPRECLPSDLGGHLPSIEHLCAQNTKYLESLKDHFKQEETLRVDESKREKKKKSKKVDSEPEPEPDTIFKRLEID